MARYACSEEMIVCVICKTRFAMREAKQVTHRVNGCPCCPHSIFINDYSTGALVRVWGNSTMHNKPKNMTIEQCIDEVFDDGYIEHYHEWYHDYYNGLER